MSEFPLSTARPHAQPRRTWPWLAAAIVIVAIWSFGVSLKPLENPGGEGSQAGAMISYSIGYSVGYVIGGVLFVAGAVWLVLYFGFTRRLARHRGRAHFIVLLITAAVAAAPITALKFTGMARGEPSSAAVSAIVEESRARAAEEADALRAENARILAGDPFSGHALARPGGVAAARTKLAELRQSAANARASAKANSDRMRARLAALPMSEDHRAELLTQHDLGFAAGQADTRAGEEAAAQVFDAIEGQLDVLSRRPRGWTVEGGELMFTNDRDMNDFNAHVRAFQAAQARANAALATLDEARTD